VRGELGQCDSSAGEYSRDLGHAILGVEHAQMALSRFDASKACRGQKYCHALGL
jgi:hypothetical protein